MSDVGPTNALKALWTEAELVAIMSFVQRTERIQKGRDKDGHF